MSKLGLPETCWDRPRCKWICWDRPRCKAHSITVADSSKPSRTMADSSKTQQRNKRSNEALARRRCTAFSERCSMAAPTTSIEPLALLVESAIVLRILDKTAELEKQPFFLQSAFIEFQIAWHKSDCALQGNMQLLRRSYLCYSNRQTL